MCRGRGRFVGTRKTRTRGGALEVARANTYPLMALVAGNLELDDEDAITLAPSLDVATFDIAQKGGIPLNQMKPFPCTTRARQFGERFLAGASLLSLAD